MNSPSRFDGEVSKPYFPHFSSECGHSKPTNPQQETTTKPRPSREVDGAEIFHNPKKNPIISPVLVPYPVLNPGDKGKTKPRVPIVVIQQVTTTTLEMPWNLPGMNQFPSFRPALQWVKHCSNIDYLAEENPAGSSTLVLEHSQGNSALTGFFNGITMKKK